MVRVTRSGGMGLTWLTLELVGGRSDGGTGVAHRTLSAVCLGNEGEEPGLTGRDGGRGTTVASRTRRT